MMCQERTSSRHTPICRKTHSRKVGFTWPKISIGIAMFILLFLPHEAARGLRSGPMPYPVLVLEDRHVALADAQVDHLTCNQNMESITMIGTDNRRTISFTNDCAPSVGCPAGILLIANSTDFFIA